MLCQHPSVESHRSSGESRTLAGVQVGPPNDIGRRDDLLGAHAMALNESSLVTSWTAEWQVIPRGFKLSPKIWLRSI